MTITIRRARLADHPTIVRYNALMADETEGKKLNPETLSRGVSAVLEHPSYGIYFIAEADGVVAGQLLITYEWSDWRNGNFWWIQSVYVERLFRGRGVFKALFRHIEKAAREDSAVCGLRLYVEHSNIAAQRTYAALGMSKTGYEMYETVFERKDISQ